MEYGNRYGLYGIQVLNMSIRYIQILRNTFNAMVDLSCDPEKRVAILTNWGRHGGEDKDYELLDCRSDPIRVSSPLELTRLQCGIKQNP